MVDVLGKYWLIKSIEKQNWILSTSEKAMGQHFYLHNMRYFIEVKLASIMPVYIYIYI